MTDMSHQERAERAEHAERAENADLTGHPDAAEMRERYDRILAGPRGSSIDAMVLLAGLYLAVSPWIVHFSATQPDILRNNLILGLAVAAIGLGLAAVPEKMSGMTLALVGIGTWVILSPWLMTIHQATPPRGVIWNNVVAGAVIAFFGLVAMGFVMTMSYRASHAERTAAGAGARS